MRTSKARVAPRDPLVNRAVARLLRSPLSPLVDRGVLLLTVFGRRTGRAYTFPVQYVEDGAVLWVYAGGAGKTWWRNVVGGAHVELWLKRRSRSGYATVCTPDDGEELLEAGLRRYRDRFPRTARRLGLSASPDGGAAQPGESEVMVRIVLTDAAPRTRRAVHPHG